MKQHPKVRLFFPSVLLCEDSSLCKASLDWKHINDRYHKGRTAVEAFLDKKHQFTRVSSLNLAHAGIVQQQGEFGTQGFLS